MKFPSISSLEDVLPEFSDICNAWFGQGPNLTRLALGAVLFMPTDDREQGYRLLDNYLPKLEIDVDGSSDIFYQINRPRSSMTDIPGLELNRLSKWSVLRLSAGSFRFDSDEPVVSKSVQEGFSVRLEFDLSTPSNYGKLLPVNRLQKLFGELMSLGMEIAELGDVP